MLRGQHHAVERRHVLEPGLQRAKAAIQHPRGAAGVPCADAGIVQRRIVFAVFLGERPQPGLSRTGNDQRPAVRL